MTPVSDVYSPPSPMTPLDAVSEISLASLWRRAASYLLDAIVVVVGIFILQTLSDPHQVLALATVPLQGFLFYCYTMYQHGKRGQTWGKRLLKIKVVRVNGDAVGFVRSARRSIICGLESLPFVVATMIALSQIPESQYLPLEIKHMRELKNSLMPAWYDMSGTVITAVYLAELVSCFVTSRKQSLADLMAGTMVINVESAPQ